MASGPNDFHIEIELPISKVRVWEYYELDKAYAAICELVVRLNLKFYHGLGLNY
jgi:hypothetical protein